MAVQLRAIVALTTPLLYQWPAITVHIPNSIGLSHALRWDDRTQRLQRVFEHRSGSQPCTSNASCWAHGKSLARKTKFMVLYFSSKIPSRPDDSTRNQCSSSSLRGTAIAGFKSKTEIGG
eukprot:scaffold9857_cov195-Amphora_coffeaeformis.AAC.12